MTPDEDRSLCIDLLDQWIAVLAPNEPTPLRVAESLGLSLNPKKPRGICLRNEHIVAWLFPRPDDTLFSRQLDGIWFLPSGKIPLAQAYTQVYVDNSPCPDSVLRLLNLQARTIADAITPREPAGTATQQAMRDALWLGPNLVQLVRRIRNEGTSRKGSLPSASVLNGASQEAHKSPSSNTKNQPTKSASKAKSVDAKVDTKATTKSAPSPRQAARRAAETLPPPDPNLQIKDREVPTPTDVVEALMHHEEMPRLLDELPEPHRQHGFQRGDCVELAHEFLRDLGVKIEDVPVAEVGEGQLISDVGELYRYQPSKGTWGVVPKHRAVQHISYYAGAMLHYDEEPKPLKLSRRNIIDAVDTAKELVMRPLFFSHTSSTPGICFRNGFVTREGADIKLVPHSPTHRQLVRLEVDYDPDARAPEFERFLDEVFPLSTHEDCADPHDQRKKLQLTVAQFVGACLFGVATDYQKVLILLGGGANGKSVLLSIISSLFPPHAIAAVPPHDWESKPFRLAQLFGRRINVVTEMPRRELFDGEKFKGVTDGSIMTAEKKNKDPFEFKPSCGHLFAANDLPATGDTSHGFFRRSIIAPMDRRFAEHEQDPDIARRIIANELAGVLTWAIRGAASLFESNLYAISAASKRVVDQWKDDNTPVRRFARDFLEPLPPEDRHLAISVDKIYLEYRNWCNRNNHRAFSLDSFCKQLSNPEVGLQKERRKRGIYYLAKILPPNID